MATIPSPKTWVDSEIVTPEMMNEEIRDPLDYLLNPPTAKVYKAADSNLGNALDVTVVLSATEWDTDGMSDGTGLTVVTAGLYQVVAAGAFGSNSTGYRQVTVTKNGTAVRYDRRAPVAGNLSHCHVPFSIRLAAGDQLAIKMFQNSGGLLNIPGLGLYTSLEATWVGE